MSITTTQKQLKAIYRTWSVEEAEQIFTFLTVFPKTQRITVNVIKKATGERGSLVYELGVFHSYDRVDA